MEIGPSRKWTVIAIAVGLVWWGPLLTVSVFGWLEGGDWIWTSATGLFLLSSAAITFLVVTHWRRLSLIADDNAIRFGVRRVERRELAAMRVGLEARTRAQFWAGVLAMAISQDLTQSVYFLSRDGRTLLEVSDLYGSSQLAEFASFLDVPLAGSGRRS